MSTRLRLLTWIALLVALLAVATGLERTSDLTRLLPGEGALADAAGAMVARKSTQVLLIEVDGRGVERDRLEAAVDEVEAALLATGRFARVRARVDALADGGAMREAVRDHAVALLPEEEVRARTSPEGIAAALAGWQARMAGPAAGMAARGLVEDPLDLTGRALQRLREAAGPWAVQVDGGLLLDASGERALILASPPRGVLTDAEDPGLGVDLERIAADASLPVRWFGGQRVASEMATSVQRDVAVAGQLALLALLAVLLVGFRSVRPLIGLLGPLTVTIAATAAALALRSPIHGITLGFGGALLGIAVDYWIHLYVNASQRYDGPDRALRIEAAQAAWTEIRPAILASAGTTSAAFAILLLSRFPVVRDLGATGIASILGAAIGTALIGPLAYGWTGGRAARWQLPVLPRALGLLAVLATVGFAIAGLGLRFDGDPRRLIALGEETVDLERELSARYGGIGTGGLAVIQDPDPGRALDKAAAATEALRAIPGVSVSSPSELLPGPTLAARRIDALPPIEVLRERVTEAAVAAGFQPEPLLAAVDGYYRTTPPDAETWRSTPLAEAVERSLDEQGVVLEVVLVDPGLTDAAAARLPDGVVLVVPAALAAEGARAIGQELLRLGGLASLVVGGVLLLRFRDPRRVLAAALPVLASATWSFGALALLDWPLDAVGTSVLVIVLGLAVDYGIFMADGKRHGTAVTLGAATSVAGFGTLIASRSPGLASAGLVVLVGLVGAAFTALTVTPRVAEGRLLGRSVRWVRLAAVAALVLLHVEMLLLLRFLAPPPDVEPLALPEDRVLEGPERQLGPHRLQRRHGMWTLLVSGSPAEMGSAHGILAGDVLDRLEDDLLSTFDREVPHPLAKAAILQGVVTVGAGLASEVDPRWQEELAGLVASTEDPYAWMLPGFTRKLYFHALHDIGQALVDSPLLACTGFLAGGEATADGHWILARNFDFEGGPVFDQDKVVVVRRPDDGLASVSVAFFGMIGAVTGVNEERIAVALQAAGSDASIRLAAPMTLVLREVLEEARDLDDVERILDERKGFVTELVLAVDGEAGEAVVFEVTPERVERLPAGDLLAVSNHLRTDAFAEDAENARRIRYQTTTPRLQRMEELTEAARGRLDLEQAVAILRDRSGPGGVPLPRGHRWALDADIATHAVAIDATAGVLWVSLSPNLAGGFVGYRLDDLFAGVLEPEPVVGERGVADTLTTHRGRELLRAAGRSDRLREKEQLLRDALRHLPGHPSPLLALAEVLVERGEEEEARQLLERAEAVPLESQRERELLATLRERLR